MCIPLFFVFVSSVLWLSVLHSLHPFLCNTMLPGFDDGEISEDGPIDLEGLDASAAHVAKQIIQPLIHN